MNNIFFCLNKKVNFSGAGLGYINKLGKMQRKKIHNMVTSGERWIYLFTFFKEILICKQILSIW